MFLSAHGMRTSWWRSVLNSPGSLQAGRFKQSHRRQRFLEYLVNEALEGRVHKLKGYTIGVEIFDRPTSFDPMSGSNRKGRGGTFTR